MPFAGGLGFDGIQYAWLAKNFTKLLDGSLRLNIVSYNRFLPSLLCGLTLSGLGIRLEDHNIVLFFECYNIVLLTGSAWLWGKIAAMVPGDVETKKTFYRRAVKITCPAITVCKREIAQ